MVWFQCEDCGENLKKPKLLNHFRICSANNLSCIDCGVIFEQQNVLGHTQCITEAEKYGPKGQGKGFETSSTKPKNDAKQKQKPDVDINIGLSQRPPWFCSICNTKATSRQTLLLHAEGKKHRAKARAHAAKQHPKPNEVPSADANIANGAAEKDESPSNQDDPLEVDVQKNSEEMNGNKPKKNKKRNAQNPLVGSDNMEVAALNGKAEADETKHQAKKGRYSEPGESMVVESCKEEKKKIRWKELTASALKSNPDGKLKMKKLRKVLLKTLKDSGVNEDGSQFGELLEKKIISSSRFAIVGKFVHLLPRE